MDAISRLLIMVNEMDEDNVFAHVGHTILKEINQIPQLTIYQLADACAVSAPTVSRFVKQAGFSSYPAFKIAIAMELMPEQSRLMMLKREKIADARLEIDSFLRNCGQLLTELGRQTQPARMREIVGKMKRASRVLFLMGDSPRVRVLQKQLYLDGKQADLHRSPKRCKIALAQMHAGDMIVTKMTSEWEAHNKLSVLQQAHERGVLTLAFSLDGNGCTEADVDYLFHTDHLSPLEIVLAEEAVFEELIKAYWTYD